MSLASALLRQQPLLGVCPKQLSGVARDSRTVRNGEAYVAQAATAQERVLHAAQARERGAAVIIARHNDHGAGHGEAHGRPLSEQPFLITPHARWSFARASAALAGVDLRCPPLLGTTGTKGKSTVTHLAWWLLGHGGARIGTIGWHDGSTEKTNPQTTPPAEELHPFLASLPAQCPGVALELSSHGCDQQRLAGLRMRALAVTGIGHDHLDYHGTRAAYISAKLRSVLLLEPGGLLVLRADDAYASLFAAAGRTVGVRVDALSLEQARSEAWPIALPGSFNAWNVAAAVRLVASVGVDATTARQRLTTMPAVPGRLELLARAPLTYVDYAHTPESITAVITAVREAHPGAPVAIVFGCGGERDPSKRAPMGAAASAADVLIITTDNSRSEDPAAIAKAIHAGVTLPPSAVDERTERSEAIIVARERVGPKGVVIVAGKGHERSQDIRGVVTAWDDRAFVRTLPGGLP